MKIQWMVVINFASTRERRTTTEVKNIQVMKGTFQLKDSLNYGDASLILILCLVSLIGRVSREKGISHHQVVAWPNLKWWEMPLILLYCPLSTRHHQLVGSHQIHVLACMGKGLTTCVSCHTDRMRDHHPLVLHLRLGVKEVLVQSVSHFLKSRHLFVQKFDCPSSSVEKRVRWWNPFSVGRSVVSRSPFLLSHPCLCVILIRVAWHDKRENSHIEKRVESESERKMFWWKEEKGQQHFKMERAKYYLG